MKKLIIPILALILSGSFYFFVKNNLFNDNTGPETVTQTNNNTISTTDLSTQSVTDENKNKSNKEETQKAIINTTTGENVPEGFYDKVLADGYTYNNPKPIPDSWIIEPAGDGYPATIDYYKFFDEASDSQTLPGKIGSKTAIPDYMYGYSPRTLDISFRTKPDSISSKADFTKWFKDNYDLDFLYVTMNNSHNYGGRLWSIYVTEGELEDIKNVQSDIISNYHVRVTNLSLYLQKYRGTDELKKFREINKNSGLF